MDILFYSVVVAALLLFTSGCIAGLAALISPSLCQRVMRGTWFYRLAGAASLSSVAITMAFVISSCCDIAQAPASARQFWVFNWAIAALIYLLPLVASSVLWLFLFSKARRLRASGAANSDVGPL